MLSPEAPIHSYFFSIVVVVLDPSPCCVVVLLLACPVVGSEVERVLLAWPVDGLTVEEFVVLWPSGFSVVIVLVVDWAKPALPRDKLIPNATAANLNADCIISSRSIYQRTPRTPVSAAAITEASSH